MNEQFNEDRETKDCRMRQYYLCILGNFDGVEGVFQKCVANGVYQYHKNIPQKGCVKDIVEGDILILVYRKELRAYAVAANQCGAQVADEDGWISIPTKGGWRSAQIQSGQRVPAGAYAYTLEGGGTKQSIVKHIEALWATELVQIIKRTAKEGAQEFAFPLQLEEFAVGIMGPDRYFTIPDVQRGLVWDPVRCEILWDSIMRGIPIGAISVRRDHKDAHWEIFDGQQRSNAIELGYREFSLTHSAEDKCILWIDLNPSAEDMAGGSDENENSRQFYFRLTTAAHPWGYALSKKETATSFLPVYEQKCAVTELEQLGGTWKPDLVNKRGARPYPCEMWPFKAGLPVPFSALREYVERCKEPKFTEFCEWVGNRCAEANWLLKLSKWRKLCGEDPVQWESVIHAIQRLPNYMLVALNSVNMDNRDVGLYFKRMNKSGMVPDNEEINYSLLKARIPAVKGLDEYKNKEGNRIVAPARLAHIAMRYWLSTNGDKDELRGEDVKKIVQQREAFSIFISLNNKEVGGFHSLVFKLNTILLGGGKSDSEADGLLPLHVQQIFNAGDGGLAVLLLRYCAKGEVDAKLIPALATVLLWFSKNLRTCVGAFWKASTIESGLKKVFADEKNGLTRIPEPEELEQLSRQMHNALLPDKEPGWEDAYKICQFSPYCADALNKIWSGFHDGNGCPILLYACRHFIRKWFHGYDTCSPEWSEQNRPWDYDHIIPQKWLDENYHKMSSDWRLPLCRYVLGSIGNSAPIPFGLNRGRQAEAPGSHYPHPHDVCEVDAARADAIDLHVKQEIAAEFDPLKDGERFYRRTDGKPVRFVCACMERIAEIYKDWYESCCVEELMKYSSENDVRRTICNQFRKQFLSEHPGWSIKQYFRTGCFQKEIARDWDWAREYISVGVPGTIKVGGTLVRCLMGVVAGPGNSWEWGACRYPSESEVCGQDVWWAKIDDNSIHAKSEEGLDIQSCIENLKRWMDDFEFIPDATMTTNHEEV